MTTEQLETLRAAAEQMAGRAGELLRMAVAEYDALSAKLYEAYAANQHSFDAGEKRARDWYESKLEHVRAEGESLRRQLEQAGQRGVPDGWKLVPLEPTEAELVAGLNWLDPLGKLINWSDGCAGFTREHLREVRAAMLAAAPVPLAAPAADAQPADTVQVPRKVLGRLASAAIVPNIFDVRGLGCIHCGTASSTGKEHDEGCPVGIAQRLLAVGER